MFVPHPPSSIPPASVSSTSASSNASTHFSSRTRADRAAALVLSRIPIGLTHLSVPSELFVEEERRLEREVQQAMYDAGVREEVEEVSPTAKMTMVQQQQQEKKQQQNHNREPSARPLSLAELVELTVEARRNAAALAAAEGGGTTTTSSSSTSTTIPARPQTARDRALQRQQRKKRQAQRRMEEDEEDEHTTFTSSSFMKMNDPSHERSATVVFDGRTNKNHEEEKTATPLTTGTATVKRFEFTMLAPPVAISRASSIAGSNSSAATAAALAASSTPALPSPSSSSSSASQFIKNAFLLGHRPSINSVAARGTNDETLKSVLDSTTKKVEEREEEKSKDEEDDDDDSYHEKTSSSSNIIDPTSSLTSTTALPPALTRSPLLASITTTSVVTSATDDLTRAVLDEWTSSDDDDIPISAEFKAQTKLSRSRRREYGLKSMREVVNLLAKPMMRRRENVMDASNNNDEDDGDGEDNNTTINSSIGSEYSLQTGAFQSIPYWPENGRFKGMKLIDRKQTIQNKGEEKENDSSSSSIPTTTSTLHMHPQMQHALALLDPEASLPKTANTGSITAGSNNSTTGSDTLLKRQQAAYKQRAIRSLLRATHQAPFIMLRRDMMEEREKKRAGQAEERVMMQQMDMEGEEEGNGEENNDPSFTRSKPSSSLRIISNPAPLLTDAQIDRLLLQKIDASLRKGYSRNRADLRSLSSKGGISFGVPKMRGEEVLQREMEKLKQGAENSMTSMFYDVSGRSVNNSSSSTATTSRRTKSSRPFSASTTNTAHQATLRQISLSHASTRHANHSVPPVGAYNPLAVETAIPSVEIASMIGRDRPATAGARISVAASIPGVTTESLLTETSHAPVPRLFDLKRSDLARRDQPGVTFSRAAIGERTCLKDATGRTIDITGGKGAGVSVESMQKTLQEKDFLPVKEAQEMWAPIHRTTKVYSSFASACNVNQLNNALTERKPPREIPLEMEVRHQMHSARKMNSTQILQHSGTSTIGTYAALPHARRAESVGFARGKRFAGDDSSKRQHDSTLRTKSFRESATEQRLAQESRLTQDEEVKQQQKCMRVEEAERKKAKERKFVLKMRELDKKYENGFFSGGAVATATLMSSDISSDDDESVPDGSAVHSMHLYTPVVKAERARLAMKKRMERQKKAKLRRENAVGSTVMMSTSSFDRTSKPSPSRVDQLRVDDRLHPTVMTSSDQPTMATVNSAIDIMAISSHPQVTDHHSQVPNERAGEGANQATVAVTPNS